MTPARSIGLLAIIGAALLWSTGGVFIKLIQLGSMQITGLRSVFTLVTFLVLFRRKNFLFNSTSLLAGLCYAGILILFVSATKLTTAANAIFLQYTASIYVLIFEPVLLKTKFRLINLFAIVFCFGGMSLFFLENLSAGGMSGNLLALASGAAFAGFLLTMRKNEPQYQLPSIFLGNCIILVICLPAVFSIGALSAADLGMSAFLGVFQIGIAYALFTYGLKVTEAIEASLISMIEPVLNPVWVFIWYGERPSNYAILGGAVILTAIALRTAYLELPVRRLRSKSAG